MARHKMAAADVATDRITSKECHGFFSHIFGLHFKTPCFDTISTLLLLQRSEFLEKNNKPGSAGRSRLPSSSSLRHDHLLED